MGQSQENCGVLAVMRGLMFMLWVCARAASLPAGVTFLPGPVNGLLVQGKVVVYGGAGGHVKGVRKVLFTHARRDVVWAGAPLVAGGSDAIVPERERALFENPSAFWSDYE